MIAYDDGQAQFHLGDALTVLRELPAESAHCIVTSPPYWGLRDYGDVMQLGIESSPALYVERMVEMMRAARLVLRPDGSCWLVLGDTYASSTPGPVGGFSTIDGGRGGAEAYREAQDAARWGGRSATRERFPEMGIKNKDLMLLPFRIALAMQADGWWLRAINIWDKPSPMPSSAKDRTTVAHEYVLMFTRSEQYYYDAEAIAEPAVKPAGSKGSGGRGVPDHKPQGHRGPLIPGRETRNKRSVWRVPAVPSSHGVCATCGLVWLADAPAEHCGEQTVGHFAAYPPELIRPCILAGCPEGGTVLDIFLGTGTTAIVAKALGRRCVGIELNPHYLAIAKARNGQLAMIPAEQRMD